MKFLTSAAVALVCLAVLFQAGCSGSAGPKLASGSGEKFAMTVAFPSGSPLRYKVSCKRTLVLSFSSGSASDKSAAAAKQETNEDAEFVLAFKAMGPAPRGGTLVEATCEKAVASRNKFTGGSSSSDAIATLAGKTWTFSVSASGRIFDTNSLDTVVRDLGEAAFGGRSDRYEGRRIKNPDMIGDFIAVQWYMWDQQQSIPNPLAGVAVGQQWLSPRYPLAPMPFVSRFGRRVTYSLASIEHAGPDARAVINSTYSLAGSQSLDWPIPYGGSFSQRGSFGFFHGYQPLELFGRGTQLFDLTNGVILSDTQAYTVKISAAIPFGGLVSKEGEKPEPNITVTQTIAMNLLPHETGGQ